MNEGVQTQTASNGPERQIPDEWLLAYAAGNLSEAKSTLVATHASYHPELREKINDAEHIGGALLSDADSADLSDGFLDRVLDQIDAIEKNDTPAVETKSNHVDDPRIPAPLAEYLGHGLDDVKWRFMGPGLRQAKLWTGKNGEKLWLLKARGGTEMPEHDHRGTEMTLVLQGSYTVDGHRFGVGDLELAAGDIVDHRPIIDEGEDCICLVVTEAPIKLKTMIGRAFQPFIGL